MIIRSPILPRPRQAKVETSYIDRAGQTDCNSTVEQAELPDIGKTSGSWPVGQIGAAAHFSFIKTER
jgi:hypothetical protein